MKVDVMLGKHRLKATMDSGAFRVLISPRAVERLGIPYQNKERPLKMVLADDSPVSYGDGVIRLETKPMAMTISGISEVRSINIMDLGTEDMLIGHDWLLEHNPIIDWVTDEITPREPK